jgi:hypothetical protein
MRVAMRTPGIEGHLKADLPNHVKIITISNVVIIIGIIITTTIKMRVQ